MRLFSSILVLLLVTGISSCQSEGDKNMKMKDKSEYKVTKTDAEWKAELTDEEYYVLRKKGTERAWTGEFNDFKNEGVYVCAACGHELFSSEHKYDSGSGWPSYFKPINDSAVAEETDSSNFMIRTEVLCPNCGGHLGHVFDDGPKPTGLRYCINSVSMDFKPKDGMKKNEMMKDDIK